MLWFCVSNSEVGLHYEATSQIDDVKPEQWRLDSHFLEAWGIGDVISIMGGWDWEDEVWNRMEGEVAELHILDTEYFLWDIIVIQ